MENIAQPSGEKKPDRRGRRLGNVDGRRLQDRLKDKELLDGILEQSGIDISANSKEAGELACALKDGIERFDMEKAQSESLTDASEFVTANAEFFLGSEVIASEPYVQRKMSADIMIVAEIMKQSKISDYSIMKMIQMIEEGSVHPRVLEVLSSLVRTKVDIMKVIAAYIPTMESGYKFIKEEVKIKRNENTMNVETEIMPGDALVTRGTRNIISQIREAVDIAHDEIKNEDEE